MNHALGIRRLWGAALVVVALIASACTSSTNDAAVDSTTTSTVAAATERPTLTAPSGPIGDRIDSSSALGATLSFLAAWSGDDYHSVVQSFEAVEFDPTDLTQISRPGFYFDPTQITDESETLSSRLLLADLMSAIDRAGTSAIDLDHPVASIESRDDNLDNSNLDNVVVEVTFDSREPVQFTMAQTDKGWRVQRIDEIGAVAIGAVFGMVDPAAGTGWTWCGFDEPVVFEGQDCANVLAGEDGLTDEQRAEIEAIREESVQDPSRALELAQAMQLVMGQAPGQVCRLLQTGQVPVGEAEIGAAEMAETICPEWQPLDATGIDYSGTRYGELELSSPTAAVETLIDAWTQQDWWDAHVTFSSAGRVRFETNYEGDLGARVLADGEPIQLDDQTPSIFVALFSLAEPALSIGELTSPVEIVSQDTTRAVVRAETSEGPLTFAVEQVPSDRWRVRAISQLDTGVDPEGAMLQLS